ncbi:MAG: cytochrome P450 [Myxococcota bacterium]
MHDAVDASAVLDRATIDAPHPFYRALRERGPIHRVGATGVHLVVRWDAIEEALGREADFSANLTGVLIRAPGGEPAVFELPSTGATDVIATADEPAHGVHRGLLQPHLRDALVAALEPRLRTWARDAIDAFVARGGGDFAADVAELVPARTVVALLDLAESDVANVRRWAMMGGDMLAGDVDAARMATLGAETAKMAAFLGERLERARAELERAERERGDARAPASLAHVLARGARDGTVDATHAVGIALVLFGAAGESTASLVGNAARLLAEQPALAARLRAEPALVPRFVEEVVRLEPPFKGHYRAVRRACTLAGAALAPGDRLFLAWASANRDAAVVEAPDELRLDRRFPKRHMGFGRGSHFCIGAHLARLEGRVVVEELLARTSDVALDPARPPAYTHSMFVRRHDRLPLVVRAAAD